MGLKPGYKQTELGVIPEDWEIKSLSQITDTSRPISYGIVQTGDNIDNGIRCVRVIDLYNSKINKEKLVKTSPEISNSYKRTILRTGDLIIALRGKIGELAVVDSDLSGSNLTRGLALIAVNGENDSFFLCYYLSSSKSKAILERNLNGSALQEISIGTLRKIPAIVPPLSEQQAIAAALRDMDALITSLDTLITKKRDIKQAAMQQLLTGKTRLPSFSEAKINYKQTEVGLIPDDWEVKPVGEFCNSIVPGRNKPKVFNGAIPWITIPDIRNKFIIKESESGLGLTKESIIEAGGRIVPAESVIMSCVGEFGLIAIASRELVINQQLHAFVCSSSINSYFLSQALKMQKPYMEKIAALTTLAYMNKAKCESIPIALPSIAEQQSIAAVLSDMDAEIAALEQQREKTRALKQGMMQELLTGRTRLI